MCVFHVLLNSVKQCLYLNLLSIKMETFLYFILKTRIRWRMVPAASRDV